MSIESFTHLARLTGAVRPPAPGLYDGSWPGLLRRCLQITVNAVELLRSRGTFVAVHGTGVPVAVGLVHADERLSVRALLSGSCILRGARLTILADRLAIDRHTQLELFLATEDVLIVFGERSGAALAIHISASEDHLGRQRQGLEMARKIFAECHADNFIPRVIEWRRVDGAWALLQERLGGRTVDPARLSAQALEAYIEAAMKPLLWLDSLAEPCDEGPDFQMIFDGLRNLECHSVLAAQITRPLEALRNWPERQHFRTVFAHGDYWFQNLLFAEDGSAVLTGIIDWERCRMRALPGSDALYMVAFGFSHWRGCPEFQVLCDLWDDRCEPFLRRLIERVCTAFRMSTDDLRFVAILMWLMHLRLRGPWMMEWPAAKHQEWITLPAASVGRWLSRIEPFNRSPA